VAARSAWMPVSIFIASMVVKGLEIPISVTGIHFDTIEPHHPVFRYAESLYDAASRAGVSLFPNMFTPFIDEPADHLLPEPRQRWLTLDTKAAVSSAEALEFLGRLALIFGVPTDKLSFEKYAQKTVLSRAELAGLIHSFARLSLG
jgi:hypothetical protein